MSASTQQLRKICTTHTNPGLDNPFRLMLPNCHSGFSLPSQPIPHKHTLQLHWPLKTQGGPLQNQVAAFQRYKIEFKKNCPSPMATTYCHRSSQDHTRPDFLAPAFVIKFLTFKRQCCLFFVAQIRIATFWTITVCCYFRICVHVHTARLWGIVSWVLVGRCCTVFGT